MTCLLEKAEEGEGGEEETTGSYLRMRIRNVRTYGLHHISIPRG